MTKLEDVARAMSDAVLLKHQILLDDQAMTLARAAVEALRDPDDLKWNSVLDLILSEKAE